VSQIDHVTLRSLRCFVYRRLYDLQWRHSGLGMLQAYILEGRETEVRVHIWHPSLKLDGIDDAGFSHDHRFDLTSWVLAGQLTHVEIMSWPDPRGRWKIYEVVNARKALIETGSRAGELRLMEGAVAVEKNAMAISGGQSYFYPKRTFHESRPHSPVVITIALKTNQDQIPARVLCDSGRQPLNAFGTPLPESQLHLVLAEAADVLRKLVGPHFGGQPELIANTPELKSKSNSELRDSFLKLNDRQSDMFHPSPYEGGLSWRDA
jgi:hypothetical protein